MGWKNVFFFTALAGTDLECAISTDLDERTKMSFWERKFSEDQEKVNFEEYVFRSHYSDIHEHHGVSNHRPLYRLFNNMLSKFELKIKKTSKLDIFSDPDMHHGGCVTHVPWCMPRSLVTSKILCELVYLTGGFHYKESLMRKSFRYVFMAL